MTQREGPTSVESARGTNTMMKEKTLATLSSVKEKISCGRTGSLEKSSADGDHHDASSDRTSAEGDGQKVSFLVQLKDKMPGQRKETHGLAGVKSGLGYEKAHSREDVKDAEHGHKMGEKLAHMMPGPPYVHRHQTNDYAEADD